MNQAQEDNELKELLSKRFKREISDADLLEIKQSLFHLGSAIHRYHQLRKKGDDES